MKMCSVSVNNRRNEFQVVTRSGAIFSYPYAKSDPAPDTGNRITEVLVDRELANEAFTYKFESGEEGTVHIEQVLEFNEDPKHLADLLTYRLTIEARDAIDNSGLSRRQVAARLKTSLLHIRDRNVELVIRKKDAA